MRGFLSALRFLTAIPLPKSAVEDFEFDETLVYFPLVGLVVGVLVGAANLISSALFPPLVSAAVTVSMWAWVTGGLHLDGLADSADGLFSSRVPEERRRIMKDATVGSFGAVTLVLLLLFKYSGIATLQPRQSHIPSAMLTSLLFSAPVFARSMMIYAMLRFPPAEGSGLGSAAQSAARAHSASRPWHLGTSVAVCAALPALLLTLSASAWILWIALAASWVVAELFGAFVVRRIGGFTGDTYGALCEAVEATTILTVVAFAAAP